MGPMEIILGLKEATLGLREVTWGPQMSLGTKRRLPGASWWSFPASRELLLSSGGSLCSTEASIGSS